MDANCANKQWNWIRVANYFGTPLADWVHGYMFWVYVCVHVFWAWRMGPNEGVPTLFAYCEKIIWKLFFQFCYFANATVTMFKLQEAWITES